jgi:predicted dehydrogenase
MRNVRFGIVGLGHRGRAWMRIIDSVEGARLVALCERYGPLLDEAMRSAGDGDVSSHRDLDAILDSTDVDAIAVTVEPHNQPDIICRALESGKPVICEVPLAYTIEDCWRIVLAVESTGLPFAMAEQLRYSGHVQAWRKMVQEGELGKILMAEGQYLHGMGPDKFWLDGNTGRPLTWEEVATHANPVKSRFWHMPHPILYLPHELSPLLKILDDRVARVTCLGTRPESYCYRGLPVPDLEVAVMRTSRDTVLRLAAGFNAPTPVPNHWFSLMGTKGCVETNRSEGDTAKRWLAGSVEKSKAEASWDAMLPDAATRTGHWGLDYFPLADFVDAIRAGRSPEMDVYTAVETAAPAILAAKSAEEGGRPFDVPDFRPGPGRSLGSRH